MRAELMERDPTIICGGGDVVTVEALLDASFMASVDEGPTTGVVAETARVNNDGPLLYPAIELHQKNDMSGTARFLAGTALAGVEYRSWAGEDSVLRVHPTNEAGVVAFKELQVRQEELREEIRLLKQQRAMEPAMDGRIRPFTEAQAAEWERRERRDEKINRHLFTLVDSSM